VCVLIGVGSIKVRGSKGVTLVELLVVLVVVSIALSIVTPSFNVAYETWLLRSISRRTVALFRFASDTARHNGGDIAAYYDDHHLVLLQNGSILRAIDIPASVLVSPQKPHGAVFLPTGQIVSAQQFVLENSRGRKASITFGPLPGQVGLKEGSD
jgi:prepilin-type N-terminal cleavage/methylation domain-containing protein